MHAILEHKTRAGQASALAEGGPQTVIKLLECSLWPAATAVGCRAITALARTRKQKVGAWLYLHMYAILFNLRSLMTPYLFDQLRDL